MGWFWLCSCAPRFPATVKESLRGIFGRREGKGKCVFGIAAKERIERKSPKRILRP